MKSHKIGILFFASACALQTIAETIPYEPLSSDVGYALVKEFFSRVPFWTGAWDNDKTCVLPFQWRADDKRAYTYCSLAEYKYFDGMGWEIWEISSGRLLQCKYEWSPQMDVWFTPDQLFEIQWANGKKMLAYHNERYGKVDYADWSEGVALVTESWASLSVGTNGIPQKKLMPGGIVPFFADANMQSINIVIPHRYCGSDAIIPKTPSREAKRLAEAEAAGSIWKLSEQQKVEICRHHQKYLSGMPASPMATNIFIVACDGNFDGKVDAFVSSDAEGGGKGAFKWTLYAGDGIGFARADKPTAMVFGKIEKLEIDNVVLAGKNDFFRLDRIGLPPYVMPIVGGELWNYAHQESCVKSFRNKQGMENALFNGCLELKGVGIASLNDLFLMHSMLVSAKRLTCEEIFVQQAR